MIHAEGLGKRFDDFWAVEDFTLDVAAGEVVAVLGPNGAGKTTTVRMLVSVLQPTRGHATVAGFDVATQGLDVRAHVGVLTEQHGLYTRMPAEEYLDFFAQIYGLDERLRAERIERWLRYFGLWEYRSWRIATYSKGMRQKLALARALLHEPPVLLLDEPTSAMDPESARLVREAIRGLRSQERAIVLCTHNLYEAEELADRIAIMRRGRLIAVGTPDDLKNRWLGPPMFELVLDRVPSAPLPTFPPEVEVLQSEGPTIYFRSPDWEHFNPLVVQTLVSAGYGIRRLSEIPRHLEQVYLEVMAQ
ncbi:MAG: ABC transporter ATP-binding protein [Chloroflexi bacterium]|nr:ABC transporter ATP-binding protein [Chloroflexota bacterium]